MVQKAMIGPGSAIECPNLPCYLIHGGFLGLFAVIRGMFGLMWLRRVRSRSAARTTEPRPVLERRNRGSGQIVAAGGVRTTPGGPCRASALFSSHPRPVSSQLMSPNWFDESRNSKASVAGPVCGPAMWHEGLGRPSHRASPETIGSRTTRSREPHEGMADSREISPGAVRCRCGECDTGLNKNRPAVVVTA